MMLVERTDFVESLDDVQTLAGQELVLGLSVAPVAVGFGFFSG